MKTNIVLAVMTLSLAVGAITYSQAVRADRHHHGGGREGGGAAEAAALGFLFGAAAAGNYNYDNNAYYPNYYPAYQRCYYRCVRWDVFGRCYYSQRYCYYTRRGYYYRHGCDQWGRCW